MSKKIVTIPVQNPSAKRGRYVKYGYTVYNEDQLNVSNAIPPLILLPGWTGAQDDWEQLPLLISKANNRTVITIDHRGIGASHLIFNDHITSHYKSPKAIETKMQRPIPEITFDDMCNDLYHLISNTLPSKKKIDLLGWSMGGMIASQFALKYPQLINHLILYATMPGGKQSEQFRTKKFNDWVRGSTVGLANAKTKEDMMRQMKINMEFQFGYNLVNKEETLSRLLELVFKCKRPYKTIIAQSAMNHSFEGTDLEKLNDFSDIFGFNISIIHGDCDNVLPIGNAYLMNEKLKNSKLFVLKGEGHWIHGTKSGMKRCVQILNHEMDDNTYLTAKL